MAAASGKSGRDGRSETDEASSSLRDRMVGMFRSVPSVAGRPPELLLIPQSLRTADPGLYAEIAGGTFGLAGALAHIDGTSPFRVRPPSLPWLEALHGFGWLTDLRSAGAPDASSLARRTVADWIARKADHDPVAWKPGVAGRRLISWLSNSGMLIESAPPHEYDALLGACDQHMQRLSALAVDPRAGMARLIALTAVVMGGLCMSDQEQRLSEGLRLLLDELDRQILPDGSHVSRHPGVTIDLLLDLLPLKQCFVARDTTPPARLLAAMGRIVPMLRHMQLGDRRLARFNGMGATELDHLATVLAFDLDSAASSTTLRQGSYVRMMRRNTIVIMDAGAPPPLDHSGAAHAGALSFEMSSGRWPMIVNCGAPGPADLDWTAQARGTAAHSTVVLNDTASARLVRGPAGASGEQLLMGPSGVDTRLSEPEDGSIEVQTVHNGYFDRLGMMHARVLRLSAQGNRLTGIDRIYQPQRLVAAGKQERTYSIHFHVHPQASVKQGPEPNSAEITLRSGEVWHLAANGSKLGLEDSLFLANFTGPLRTVQIVLRGHAFEDTQVRWRIERVAEGEKS